MRSPAHAKSRPRQLRQVRDLHPQAHAHRASWYNLGSARSRSETGTAPSHAPACCPAAEHTR
eukprot:1015836-Prymnesium_polylepis.1